MDYLDSMIVIVPHSATAAFEISFWKFEWGDTFSFPAVEPVFCVCENQLNIGVENGTEGDDIGFVYKSAFHCFFLSKVTMSFSIPQNY